MTAFDYRNRTHVVFGAGMLQRIGELAVELRFARTLLVSDPGMVATGYVDRAIDLLKASGIDVVPFHAFGENPDTAMLATGRDHAAAHGVDSIVALGGGSSLDCAKGINFLLHAGRGDARLSRLRQGDAADAADDRRADDGRHRQRSAVFRRDF